MKITKLLFSLMMAASLFFAACKKDDSKPLEAVEPDVSTTAVSAITLTTAVGGGNVSSDGGDSVTARGVCWSTSSNPTITGNKTTDGTGTGAFTSNLAGLAAAVTYYVRAYATNSEGTAYGNELTFTTLPYALGSTGPAGGLIFYDKGSFSDGWRFLEAAPDGPGLNNQIYNCYGVITGATGQAIGTGKTNTEAIINANCPLSSAAKGCDEYSLGGYSDWFLPSPGEMEAMHDNLYVDSLGDFDGWGYWTSQELSDNFAGIFFFDSRITGSKFKNEGAYFRPIRQF